MTTSTFLEIINIGVAPNDGTGDPIRDAFDKVNKNFSTLFASTSLVTVSGLKLTDLADTPKGYGFTVSPPSDGAFVLSTIYGGNTYTNKYFKGVNDITVIQTGTNVVVSHLYTATTASIANTLVLRDSTGNISGGGYAGSFGFTGSRGVGFTGSQGNLGFTGSQGAGFIGSQGAGFTGSQGDLGFTGSQGNIGFIGSQGAGPAGPAGYTGSSGAVIYVQSGNPGAAPTNSIWIQI
jgi:hypothetical protein